MNYWRAHARLVDFGNSVQIIFHHPNEKDEVVVLTAEGLKTLPSYSSVDHLASIYLKREEAQGLMDSLWTCGLRPSEGTGSAGAMSAAQEHIRDLQSVYKKLFELVEGLYLREPAQVPVGTLEKMDREQER